MPWRLIGFIVLFVVFLVFIGFNLENRCDISFGFFKLSGIPVYLTAFTSFALGMIWAIPYIISFRFKRKPGENTKDGFLKKQEPKKDQPTDADEILPGPGGPYGIN
jgi:uncharacterized integral membrane protein